MIKIVKDTHSSTIFSLCIFSEIVIQWIYVVLFYRNVWLFAHEKTFSSILNILK